MAPISLILTPRGLRFGALTYPCSIGRGGLTKSKREGDGATPIGVHRIVGTLYRPDRLARPSPWAKPIGPRDLWSDAEGDEAYNHWVRAPYVPSHERLRRPDPLYDIVLLTDWNWPDAIQGAGSAIFLHQWRRQGYPTEGCIALGRKDLHQLVRYIVPGTRLIVPSINLGRVSGTKYRRTDTYMGCT